MAIAVEDHRASNKKEPRNIYGKIVSSADRNTSVEEMLKRTYSYNKKHYPNLNEKEIIKECYKHIKNKYGKDGYATKKMYFKDEEYDNYLKKTNELTQNKETFIKEMEKLKWNTTY